MSGRFLSSLDLHEARRKQDIRNSYKKRGLIYSPENIVREAHVVCGCGVQGCIFITEYRKGEKNENS